MSINNVEQHTVQFWAQTLGSSHQHTLQSIKKCF